jgi:cytochrome c oxidase subunit 2
MNREALLALPAAATAYADKVDGLFWAMTAVCGIVTVGIALTIGYFCFRYRSGAGTPADRRLPSPSAANERNRKIEATWIAVPFAFFMIFFAWGARLYYTYDDPPRNALEILVTAKQWMWKIEHANGRREIDELHVPVDEPIKLVMTSQDVIHDFYVPEFREKRDVLPGRYTVLWFKPTLRGVYHLRCDEYCGTGHSMMIGTVYVMSRDAYGRWLASGSEEPTLARLGFAKFRDLGCSGCHGPSSSIHAPSLAGLYGRTVPLSDGTFVRLDDGYIRDSILQPAKQIAAGYSNDMPSFQGRVSEQDLLELTAYIRSLAHTSPDVPQGNHLQ